MECFLAHEKDLNLKATELRLGLPGTEEESDQEIVSNSKDNKRALPEDEDCESNSNSDVKTPPVAKVQIVGWPPVRSHRKNSFPARKTELSLGCMSKLAWMEPLILEKLI